MSDQAKPQNPEARIAALVARGMTLCALALAAFCYLSLLRYSNLYVLLAQALVWGLALWNRRWPLYALALALPFFGNQPGAPYGMYFLDLTLWFIVGRWLWERLRRGAAPIVYTRVTPWLLMGWAVALTSVLPHVREQLKHLLFHRGPMEALFASYQASAFNMLFSTHALLDLTLSLLFFFYLADQWRGRGERRRLLRNLWIAATVAMIFGLLDFYRLFSLEWFRPLNPEILKFGYARLQSFFWHSGWFAEWLALLAPLGLAFALSRGLSIGKRIGVLALCLLTAVVVLLTYQRGGWLALATGYGAVFFLYLMRWMRGRNARRRILWVFSALVVCGGIAAGVLAYLALDTKTSLGMRLRHTATLSDRTAIWHSALTLYGHHPVLGVGLGRYFVAHVAEFPEGHRFFNVEKGEAHNTYLQVLAERGPAALLLLLLAVLVAGSSYLHRWRKAAPGDASEPWVAGGMGMLAAWLVYGCAQYLSYMRAVDLTFWMVLAATLHAVGAVGSSRYAGLDQAREKRDRARRAELRQGLSAVLCGVLESNFELRTSNFERGRFPSTPQRPSPAGLWWLLGPLLTVVVASIVFRPLFGPSVERLPACENLHFGIFRYAWFVAAGYLPWILTVGAACLALRLPSLRLPALTFAQLVRAQILLAWLLLFCGLLGFLADMRLGAGFKVFLALGVLLMLAVNASLLLARIFHAFASHRRARLALTALVLLSFFLTPILYPVEALPHWVARLMLINPLLPFVRIGQQLLVAQNVPGWGLWSGVVAWSAALALVAAFLLPKDARGRQGSEVVREKRTAA